MLEAMIAVGCLIILLYSCFKGTHGRMDVVSARVCNIAVYCLTYSTDYPSNSIQPGFSCTNLRMQERACTGTHILDLHPFILEHVLMHVNAPALGRYVFCHVSVTFATLSQRVSGSAATSMRCHHCIDIVSTSGINNVRNVSIRRQFIRVPGCSFLSCSRETQSLGNRRNDLLRRWLARHEEAATPRALSKAVAGRNEAIALCLLENPMLQRVLQARHTDFLIQCTVLCACEHGLADVIKEMLALGVSPNALEGPFELCPVHVAIMYHHPMVVVELMESRSFDVHATDTHGANVLHLVAEYFGGAYHLVEDVHTMLKLNTAGRLLTKRFVEQGVDVNATNSVGLTALHKACLNHNMPVLDALINLHYNERMPHLHVDFSCTDDLGQVPLHHVANAGWLAGTEILLDLPSIDINCIAPCPMMTPLDIACRKGHFSVALLLLRRGADTSCAGDGRLQSPLHHACARGNTRLVEVLLRGDQETGMVFSVDVNAPGLHGQLPIQCARQNRPDVIVRMLLDAGARDVAGTGHEVVMRGASANDPFHIFHMRMVGAFQEP